MAAVMAEQGAESGGRHGVPTLAAFQRNEQERGVGERPFQPQIFMEHLKDFGRQGQDALPIALAENPHLRLGQLEGLELESQDFARAQTIEQHQAD
jgi:hypothetical protein